MVDVDGCVADVLVTMREQKNLCSEYANAQR